MAPYAMSASSMRHPNDELTTRWQSRKHSRLLIHACRQVGEVSSSPMP